MTDNYELNTEILTFTEYAGTSEPVGIDRKL